MTVDVPDFGKWDLVGPTVDDDIRRAIGRYGAKAVREATQRLAKPKRGRKTIDDWPELNQVFQLDARIWLEGGDPFDVKSNYAIAKEYAQKNLGQSAEATHERIERKLATEPHNRRWYILVFAWHMSHKDWPYSCHLRALEELAPLDPNFRDLLAYAVKDVQNYTDKVGHSPPPDITMDSIRDITRNALLPPLGLPLEPLRRGIFGSAFTKRH